MPRHTSKPVSMHHFPRSSRLMHCMCQNLELSADFQSWIQLDQLLRLDYDSQNPEEFAAAVWNHALMPLQVASLCVHACVCAERWGA
jgi:hypothetical protein